MKTGNESNQGMRVIKSLSWEKYLGKHKCVEIEKEMKGWEGQVWEVEGKGKRIVSRSEDRDLQAKIWLKEDNLAAVSLSRILEPSTMKH